MPAERVVDRFHVHRHPVAVVGEARRRNHAVVGHRKARVVQLKAEPRVDDRAVFHAHRIGDRIEELAIGLVVLVHAVGDHARRRGDRKEALFRPGALERGLEVVDVALDGRLARVGDGPHARRDSRARPHRRRRSGGRVELAVELCETRPVSAAVEAVLARPGGPALEPGQALQHVLRPADGFAELSVAHDVEARLDLTPNHLRHGKPQAIGVSLLVVGLPRLLGPDKL